MACVLTIVCMQFAAQWSKNGLLFLFVQFSEFAILPFCIFKAKYIVQRPLAIANSRFLFGLFEIRICM